VVEHDRPQPTVPSVMNLQQRETLEKNENFDANKRSPSSAANEPVKSVVPEGLSGEAVSNSSENLKSEVASTVAVEVAVGPTSSSGDAKGFVNVILLSPPMALSFTLSQGPSSLLQRECA